MPEFRKKPVVVEAHQYGPGNCDFIHRWAGIVAKRQPHECGVTPLVIPTLEGEHIASPGDWIIKGVKGEFYPCKPDIFEATYEPVERGAATPEGGKP